MYTTTHPKEVYEHGEKDQGGRGAYCKLEALDEGIVGKRELIESSTVTFNRLEKKKTPDIH